MKGLAGKRVVVTGGSSGIGAATAQRFREEGAEVIVLVQDNLNTHSPASLYEAFEPAEARRLMNRFEVHYTPKHGSWLDMAEIELGILGRQCLARRIDNIADLRREVRAWERMRDATRAKANWQFTTADARIELRRLYPSVEG